ASPEKVAEWYQGDGLSLHGAGLPPVDNRPIVHLFEPVRSSRFRVLVTGTEAPEIGVISIGKALVMPHAIYQGHTPISLARETVIRPNVSERGQFLGRSIIRSGARGSWTWDRLPADWYRRYFDPFVEAARSVPFFILWRPETFPHEAAYVWTLSDIHPSNSRRDWLTVTVEAEGLGVE